MRVRAQSYPELPDDPQPGEYQCPECRCRVTVSETGRVYGHSKGSGCGGQRRCPLRPSYVDPNRADGGAGA